MLESLTYHNSAQITKLFAISNSTYNEFSHVKTTIENILKNDNHNPRQKEALTKNITAFIDMQLDTEKIYRLCNEIANSNIPDLNKYYNKQIENLAEANLAIPLCTEDRIVCLLAAAYIAESLHNLSARTHDAILDKQYFPPNFEKDLMKLRNFVFHPEREQEYTLLQQFLYDKNDVENELYKIIEIFLKHSHILIERCLAIREKQNFCMGRARETDTDIIEALKALYPIKQEFIGNFIADKLKDAFKNKKEVNIAELLEVEGIITLNILQQNWPEGENLSVNKDEFERKENIELINYYNPATHSLSSLQRVYDQLTKDKDLDQEEQQKLKKAFVKAQIHDKVFHCKLENKEEINEIIEMINSIGLGIKSMQKVVLHHKIINPLFSLAELKEKETGKPTDDSSIRFGHFSSWPQEDLLDDNNIDNKYEEIINLNKGRRKEIEKLQCEEIKQFLPKLISAIEKISMYSEDIISNAYNPNYNRNLVQAAIELFTVVAGSFVRKLTELPEESNLFIKLAKEQIGENKSGKGIKQTFFDTLKELQFHRGHIAHLEQPKANVQMTDGLESVWLYLKGARYNEFLNVGLNEILNKTENIINDYRYSSDEYCMSDDALNLEINEEDIVEEKLSYKSKWNLLNKTYGEKWPKQVQDQFNKEFPNGPLELNQGTTSEVIVEQQEDTTVDLELMIRDLEEISELKDAVELLKFFE